MRRLVLSPHADDAVWSCGGVLRRWVSDGDIVDVLTAFDGPPDDGEPGGLEMAARRRREDVAATTWFGCGRIGLGFAEAAWRGTPRRYPGPLSRRRDPHPEDGELLRRLSARLREHLSGADRPAVDVVLVPVAERTHVDHLLVRQAAEAAQAALPGRRPRLTYYREFPYAPPPTDVCWSRTCLAADPDDWIAGGLLYESQVTAMFSGRDRFITALRAHALAPDGRWVWQEWAPGDRPHAAGPPRSLRSDQPAEPERARPSALA